MNLSIIIPHKNFKERLAALLDSIPTGEWEIIVVDDHSDEPPVELISHRDDARLVPNPPHKHGAGAARNTGIKVAWGKWILFADADDLFLPGAFDTVRSYLASDADVVYFKPTSHWDGTTKPALRHTAYAALVHEWVHCGSDWIRYRFHVTWSKLVRRELIERHNIVCDETRVANDLVFSLKVGRLCADKIIATEETIYSVAQANPKSLSARNAEEYFDIRLDRHIAYNQLLEAHGLRSHRMAVLRMLKKAGGIGSRKFFQVFLLCLRTRQPFLDHWHYLWMLARRQLFKRHCQR